MGTRRISYRYKDHEDGARAGLKLLEWCKYTASALMCLLTNHRLGHSLRHTPGKLAAIG